MLRLPGFEYHRPSSVQQAIALLTRFGDDAKIVAGGTDLLPNMKHGLFTPAHLVSLTQVEDLRGVMKDERSIRIGAMTRLAEVARNQLIRDHAPALATAAGSVAGPQLRAMGTLGGNLCLDTRCTYYNQTEFWRSALGYCLKKDGTVCHVTKVGTKCVAAHSADTPPALMSLGADLEIVSPTGTRSLPVSEFFVADGIHNNRLEPGEILSAITIPIQQGRQSSYQKLRQREAIDFPMLSVAVSADFTGGTIERMVGVVSALGARPRSLTGWSELGVGGPLNDDVMQALTDRAFRQCHPLENQIVDPEWRRAMVPILVRRALEDIRAKANA